MEHNLKLILVAAVIVTAGGQFAQSFQHDGDAEKARLACTGSPGDRVANCTAWIEREPTNAKAYAERADAYQQAGKPELALKDYDQAIERQPKSAHYFRMRGSLHFDLGNFQKAVDDLTASFANEAEVRPNALSPDLARGLRASLYRRRGLANERLRKFDAAIQDFSTVLKLDPSASAIVEDRARVHMANDDPLSAVKDYTAALKYAPNSGMIYFRRGFAFYSAGRYRFAISDFNKSIKLSPNFSGPYLGLADVHMAENDTRRAIAMLRKAIELDPTFEPAVRLLNELKAKRSERRQQQSRGAP